MTTIKAISLWQPWAQLVAYGEKTFETRSWSTNHRGLLAIHAAKRFQKREQEWADMLRRRGFIEEPVSTMPLGAIVAIAHLVEVWPADHPALDAMMIPREKHFGDFRPGRFAWELEGVVRLEEPIRYPGRQGLFNVPAELLDGALARMSQEVEG